jgi:hypothetical protein
MHDEPSESDEPDEPEKPDEDDESADWLTPARLLARGTGLFWMFLAVVLGLGAVSAAATAAVPELILFGPWAVGAVILTFLLLARPPTRRLLLASLALAAASTVFGVFAIFGSGPEVGTGIIAFTLTAAGTAVYSLLTLQRLPSLRSDR